MPGEALRRQGPGRQAAFYPAYIHVGLAAALSAGFGLSAYLATHLGFGLPLSAALPALIQVHGHAQLIGWLGLLIMGVSLHFLPRLSGVPLVGARWIGAPCWLLAAAIGLRTLAQPVLALRPDTAWAPAALGLAGLCEVAGVLAYVSLIGLSLRAGRIDASTHPSIGPLRPFLVTALTGWLVVAALLGLWVLAAASAHSPLVDSVQHLLAADVFTAAVLIPVAFAFAHQTFPLYLRIERSRMPPAPFALAYGTVTAIEVIAQIAGGPVAGQESGWLTASRVSAAARGLLICAYIAGLGLHRRRKVPGTRPPERDGPARYGRFAPLIHSAFAFLMVAAVAQTAIASAGLLGLDLALRAAGVRHVYLAGFGTLLVLGMAPRMIPGFLGAPGPALPRLVLASFMLAVPAALGISLGLLPAAATAGWLRILFGCSGSLGWAAVAMLAVNLWATAFRCRAP